MTTFERIEKLRKNKGVSQGKLEKELGFSNGSISKWKNSTPTHERLVKIANYFNVSVEYLMTGKEDDIPTYNPIHIDLIDMYEKLSEENKERTLAYINKLLELQKMEKGE